MKKLIFIIVNIMVFLVVVGLLAIGFWYFGIFRQEPTLSEEMTKIKNQIEFIRNYSFTEPAEYFKSLPKEIFELPPITQEEIGRQSLF